MHWACVTGSCATGTRRYFRLIVDIPGKLRDGMAAVAGHCVAGTAAVRAVAPPEIRGLVRSLRASARLRTRGRVNEFAGDRTTRSDSTPDSLNRKAPR